MDEIVIRSFLIAGFVCALPAAVIAFFFGGRGAIVAVALLAIIASTELFWLSNNPGPDPTGLNSLAYVVVPALFAAAVIWSAIAYFFVGLRRWLPSQRKVRKASQTSP